MNYKRPGKGHSAHMARTARPPEYRRIGHYTFPARSVEVEPMATNRANVTLAMDYGQALGAIVDLADGLLEALEALARKEES